MRTPTTNLDWLKLLQGLYPKGTTDEEREVLDRAREPLDVYALAVASVVAMHWNKKEGYARPGQRRIAEGACIESTDTVADRRDLLAELGWWEPEVRQGRGGTRYYLTTPTMSHAVGHSPPEECPTSTPTMSHRSAGNVPPGRTELEELSIEELPGSVAAAPKTGDDLPDYCGTCGGPLDRTHNDIGCRALAS